MNINTISDFRAAARQGAYTFPGGYPLFYITSDGATLSVEAVKSERRQIIDSIANDHNDGWRVVALGINYEDQNLYCDHTGEPIPSAHGEHQ